MGVVGKKQNKIMEGKVTEKKIVQRRRGEKKLCRVNCTLGLPT